MGKLKNLPKFKNEDMEREFWSKNSSMDYNDWESSPSISFENLQPSTKTVSIRLPENLLIAIKTEANKRDIPYQSYMKMKLNEVFMRK